MFEERKNQVSHKKRDSHLQESFENPNENFPAQTERLAAIAVPQSLIVETGSRRNGLIWQAAVEILFGLIEGGRMVRLVGPNNRPLERHEFESAENFPQRPGPGMRW
jgi:hypothetical protein